ncbi:MBOAT family O-acyltransferase [Noviherbaspirillum saxi]|uniref:Probable alginate O-acetylase AlgI n=1 Tax=Noviherbaspirillum saxi TaxID=2320863 RepID=A0A3A3GBG6_9BURK|nr:MBOAT family protein [Noviherbaspirillum saxi]RJF98239.1 MBOAT family protein [Noviherbaspirillum saxi]
MVFSSATFLFYFFPVFLILYYVLPWKNPVLLVASLVFYAWGEPRFVPLLMFSAVLNYGVGYAMSRFAAQKKALLWFGIAANLIFLMYYKYIGFFVSVLNEAVSLFSSPIKLPEVILPLGISFFTFQGVSYLIDVYRGDVGAQKSFWNFAMYKAMFPQLIAGPIVRYKQIAHEVDHRDITNARVLAGLQQFIIGLAQKVLIANTVALPADSIFAVPPDQLSTTSAWIGIACYSIQILYDFAGYSNMAIGIGHMIGFSYPPNFNRPYSSTSVTEFWRRWHISLSSWFRDYLYIPLGGNRISAARTYVNLAMVFLLCGLWHGAAWTFIIWGAWHGVLLVIERMGLGRLLERMPQTIAQIYTLLVVMIGWVFFRANDVPYALRFLEVMFGKASADATHPWQMDFGPAAAVALLAGVLIATWRFPEEKVKGRDVRPRMRTVMSSMPLRVAGAVSAFVLCVASLAAGTYNPFIYFRF